MKYTYVGKEFDTRFLVVGKAAGCSACNNLTSFLQYALEGEFDNQITKLTLEANPEEYDAVVEKTGAMSLPIIVDLENENFISGFTPPEVTGLLRS